MLNGLPCQVGEGMPGVPSVRTSVPSGLWWKIACRPESITYTSPSGAIEMEWTKLE